MVSWEVSGPRITKVSSVSLMLVPGQPHNESVLMRRDSNTFLSRGDCVFDIMFGGKNNLLVYMSTGKQHDLNFFQHGI